MKNKDKYLLTELKFIPMYDTTGCGKRILSKFKVDVYIGDRRVGKIECHEHMLPAILEWLEEEA